MSLVKEYFQDILADSEDIKKNASRSCKYCTYEGKVLEQTKGTDYCYHCHFYKSNVNFKLKEELRLALVAQVGQH